MSMSTDIVERLETTKVGSPILCREAAAYIKDLRAAMRKCAHIFETVAGSSGLREDSQPEPPGSSDPPGFGQGRGASTETQ